MKWLKDNWDKAIPIVLAGIIGYFSGQIFLREKLGDLQTRTVLLEKEVEDCRDELAEITQIRDQLKRLDIGVNQIRGMNDISIQTSKQLDALLEIHRHKTIKELNEFMKSR